MARVWHYRRANLSPVVLDHNVERDRSPHTHNTAQSRRSLIDGMGRLLVLFTLLAGVTALGVRSFLALPVLVVLPFLALLVVAAFLAVFLLVALEP
jgi:hypothetical protein